VRKIVQFVDATPKCTRRKLIETLAPSPPRSPAPAVVALPAEATTGTEAPPAAPAEEQATPEQTALAADLHWLIHQGHVIEFANGVLETAKKPLPRPPKPEKPQRAASGEAESAASQAHPEELATAPGETPALAAEAPFLVEAVADPVEVPVGGLEAAPVTGAVAEPTPAQSTSPPTASELLSAVAAEDPRQVAEASPEIPATPEAKVVTD